MSSDFIVVLVAVGQAEEAQLIARSLVDESLAACVSMIPQNAVYRWEGETVEEKEFLLLIKTHQTQFAALRQRVLELHSSEVPEIISLAIQEGHKPYLEWIATNVKQ